MAATRRSDVVGYGDEILGSGLARGAVERGKRVSFGDGRKIIWGPLAAEIFRGNPNIAPPGSQGARDLEWVEHYPSRRAYNRIGNGRWIWNYDFKATPGELFFSDEESKFAESAGSGFIVIEPNVPWRKTVAPNKDWGRDRYEAVARELVADGRVVVQFGYGGRDRIASATLFATPSFRHALATLARASLYIGPEGGLHHGAAAVNVKAVVIFGGFIPPAVTGYDMHVNLAAGGEACGSLQRCEHCRKALDAITVEDVVAAARTQIT